MATSTNAKYVQVLGAHKPDEEVPSNTGWIGLSLDENGGKCQVCLAASRRHIASGFSSPRTNSHL